MAIASWVKGLVPDRWQVPVRFRYRRLIGVIERESSMAQSLVRPGSVAADVGANDGMYSYLFARRAAEVHAFEPIPACAATITAYARHNRRIRIHRVALSDAPGRMTLRIPVREGQEVPTEASLAAETAGGDAVSHDLDVEVRTVDSFDLRDLSMVKIDVEGHELAVIRGARETIARERPVMMIEIERRHHPGRTIDSIFGEIAELGYTGWFVDGRGKTTPISDFDADRDQRLDEGGSPPGDYVNNFFWFPVPG